MLAKSTWKLKFKIQDDWDFPGGPVVKNPPSNAGYAGSIPSGETEILHALGQLSLRVLSLLSLGALESMCHN